MSSHDPGEGHVTDESVIRAALPYHGPKRLATLMAVPVETARHWYYKRLSSARRKELAQALLDEMDRQEVQRSALRRRLAQWASED